MSHENVEFIERLLRDAQRDATVLFENLHDEVVWELASVEIPDIPSRSHGPDGVREFFRRWVSTFEEWGFEPVEIIDAGDSVVVHMHQWGRGKGSGASVEGYFWQVWKLRGGKVIRNTHYLDKAEALEAAGIRE